MANNESDFVTGDPALAKGRFKGTPYGTPAIRNQVELDRELEGHLAHFQGVETLENRIAALHAFYVDDRLDEIDTPVLALAAKDDMLVP